MTDRPKLTREHYADALALCLATLRNDEAGILSIIEHTPNVAMMIQALVRTHLCALLAVAEGDPEQVDDLLRFQLAATSSLPESPC